ncbi:MAG TPA: hypothetical protein VFO36_13605 [Nitrospiraceae bacterium]|jgi:hypothetical protein|nr:hypothetical protein [Nitrospiraceae bacterium]
MKHRYKVGQLVDYSPGRAAMHASSAQYKIVQLLPVEHGAIQYRIKSASETFERVATESQLSRRS